MEFDRVVPASGNLMVCQRQFWMGTHRAGMVARIWADCDLIHVLIAGIRIKTVRSHLSVNDLATLTRQGAVPAGTAPLPPVEDGDAIEVERCEAAASHSANTSSWPQKSPPAAASASASRRPPSCSTTSTPANCCAPAPTRSARNK
ncbi:hypothetical protein [Micromonospora tulbaghiae]|uniref:hypothetical protein n=1 Tax=Micromonospora tulbaghiae TaxID=479978 RepID=UPI0033FE7FA9